MFIREKDFYQNIFRLMLPLVLQQLLRISVDTVNSILLGRISQIEMSAVSQANQVFFIFFTVCSGLSAGCAVLTAQYWGKKDRKTISVIIAHGLRTAAIFGLFMTVVVYLFPSSFMNIYSSDPEVVRIGAEYLRKVCLMYTACGVSVMIFGASRGVEQVKLILFTNIISYSVNILLDYLLIYGKLGLPAMGAEGVAIGTVTARLTELLICGWLFLTNPEIPFTARDLSSSDPAIRTSFFRVSAPIVAHEIVWSLGTSSGAAITGQLGSDAVAGYNVTSVLYDLGASIGLGFQNACSVVLGMILGAGDIPRAKRAANSMLAQGLAIGILLGIGTYLVRPLFLRLYMLNAAANHYAMQFMTIISLIWPFSLMEMVGMIAILRAGGDGRTGFWTDLVVMWMICIPLAWFAAFKVHAEPWVVVAIIKSMIVLEGIVGVIRVYQYQWLRNLTESG